MTAAASSIDHYHSEEFQELAANLVEKITEYARKRGGPFTRHEVARDLGLHTATVSGRCCVMKDAGQLVQLDGRRPCPVTGNNVTWLVHPDFYCPVQGSLL